MPTASHRDPTQSTGGKNDLNHKKNLTHKNGICEQDEAPVESVAVKSEDLNYALATQ